MDLHISHKSNLFVERKYKIFKKMKTKILKNKGKSNKRTLTKLFLKGLGIKNVKMDSECQWLIFWNLIPQNIISGLKEFFKEFSLIPYFNQTRLLDWETIEKYKEEYKLANQKWKSQACHLLYPLLFITILPKETMIDLK